MNKVLTLVSQPVFLPYLLLALVLGGCAAAPPPKFENPVFPPPPDDPKIHYDRSITNSGDVNPDASGAAFMRSVTGARRTGVGMNKPFGVAVHQGRVFVGDSASREIHVFDYPQERYFSFGTQQPGMLGMPLGMDTDSQGNLYVVDSTFKVIQSYNRDGEHIAELGNEELFSRPSGLAVSADDGKLYIVDTGGVGSDQHHIVVLDAKTGEHIQTIGKRGTGDGDLNLARDAVVTPDGQIYVVDGGNFRVQLYDQKGEFVSKFGEVGRRGGQFSRPKGIDVDSEGRIYVSDAAFANFQIFDKEGSLLLPVGGRDQRGGPAKFMLPAGIAVDEDGRIYMVDQYFRKVEVFRPDWLPSDKGFLQKGSAVAE